MRTLRGFKWYHWLLIAAMLAVAVLSYMVRFYAWRTINPHAPVWTFWMTL